MNKLVFSIFTLVLISCNTISKEYQNISDEYYKLAKLNEKIKNNESSVNLYKKSIEFNRDNNNVSTYNFILAYIGLKEFEEAEKKMEELLSSDEKNILLINLKAYLKFKQDNLDESLELYLKTLKDAPTNKEALFNVFYIYYLKKDKSNAKSYILKYKELKYEIPKNSSDEINSILEE